MKEKKRKIIFITIIIILVLIFKNQYSFLLMRNSTHGMPALMQKGKIEHLYIGTSMFRQGVDIHLLDECFPKSNYILAYNGNQPYLEYYELEYLLNNNVEICKLYVDFYAYSAYATPAISDEKIFLETTIPYKYKMWLPTTEQQSFVENLKSFWQAFVSSNNELLISWPVSNYFINKQFYCGGALTYPAGITQAQMQALSAPPIDSPLSSFQMDYWLKLIYLAKEHNIELIFLETPKAQVVMTDIAYNNAAQNLISLLDENHVPYILTESTWNYIGAPEHILHYNFPYNDPDLFADAVHLSYNGRISFTKLLAKIL